MDIREIRSMVVACRIAELACRSLTDSTGLLVETHQLKRVSAFSMSDRCFGERTRCLLRVTWLIVCRSLCLLRVLSPIISADELAGKLLFTYYLPHKKDKVSIISGIPKSHWRSFPFFSSPARPKDHYGLCS